VLLRSFLLQWTGCSGCLVRAYIHIQTIQQYRKENYCPKLGQQTLSATRLKLESLSIHCTHSSFFESAMFGFASHLHDSDCACELKSLECKSLHGTADDSACFELAQVIQNHPTLENVSLDFYSAPNISVTSPGHNLLYRALATLNNQSKPHFILLEIRIT